MQDLNKIVQVMNLRDRVAELNLVVDDYNNKYDQLRKIVDDLSKGGLYTEIYSGQGRIDHIKISAPKEVVTY